MSHDGTSSSNESESATDTTFPSSSDSEDTDSSSQTSEPPKPRPPPPSKSPESLPPPSDPPEKLPSPPSKSPESLPPPSDPPESLPPPSKSPESLPPPSDPPEKLPPPSKSPESLPPPSKSSESLPPPSKSPESLPPPSDPPESLPPLSESAEKLPSPVSKSPESLPPPSDPPESLLAPGESPESPAPPSSEFPDELPPPASPPLPPIIISPIPDPTAIIPAPPPPVDVLGPPPSPSAAEGHPVLGKRHNNRSPARPISMVAGDPHRKAPNEAGRQKSVMEKRKSRGLTRIAKLAAQDRSEDKINSLLEEEDARIEAVYQFNASPNKNIGKLCAFFQKEDTPANVAMILHTTQGLLGEKIGDFLAKPDHEEYLKAYFRVIDLHVNFLEAMRRGLSGPFFMPGEAQQVERTIQALSEVYMEQNPGIFGHVNDPVVLGFALVMLNTDMLKPNVTRKMTVQEFVANTSGAFEHSKFPKEELEAMYQSLKENPFAFAPKSNDFMALCAPKRRGWLKKRSARFGASWSLHYFVLANSSLYYFKDESPESKDKPLGNIQLVEVDISKDPKAPNRFIVTSRGDQIQYVKLTGIPQIVAGVKSITFEAKNEAKAAEWLFRMKKSACMGSFLDGAAPAPLSDGESDDTPARPSADE